MHASFGFKHLPRILGKYPYTPKISGAAYLDAAKYNIDISPFGIIYLPPIISAYVGADIVSGILASQLHEKDGVILFVDIGTTGKWYWPLVEIFRLRPRRRTGF